MAQRTRRDDLHDDLLMIPPPGFKFIPKFETVCGKAGCFECFDIYCERCEFKDRRIVELELRNNELVKYVTQLQGKMFGTRPNEPNIETAGNRATGSNRPSQAPQQTMNSSYPPPNVAKEPFGVIQSPVLYDPKMNLSYVATTAFSPANKSNPSAKRI